MLIWIQILLIHFMNMTNPFNPYLDKYIKANVLDFSEIPADRKEDLEKIAAYVESKIKKGETAELVYICTHNSRRSHFGQLWAATAAAYYGIENIKTYSGGTEATACNERSVGALLRAGFTVQNTTGGSNPVYHFQYAENGPQLVAFSKKYDDEANPKNGFCAIMTCSSADEACPVVFGATARVSTQYKDPKAFDGTDQEAKMYDERCKQIATETFYVFSLVKK
ncbi:MAG: protein-tyrosine-phosphatase [Bacteroidetes bacterium]|nr:protein-tyrosine-phosphatase [Bacteroidota bacterium]